jgi:hypothetical protein
LLAHGWRTGRGEVGVLTFARWIGGVCGISEPGLELPCKSATEHTGLPETSERVFQKKKKEKKNDTNVLLLF